jgi:hypothetical protein
MDLVQQALGPSSMQTFRRNAAEIGVERQGEGGVLASQLICCIATRAPLLYG